MSNFGSIWDWGIVGIVLIALCIIPIIIIAFIGTNIKKDENEDEIYFKWLKDMDSLLYYRVYNRTIELLKNPNHQDFMVVFEKFLKEENTEIYNEFQRVKENIKNTKSDLKKPNSIFEFAMEAYKRMWRGYFMLQGRANRAEYWLAYLMNCIILLLIPGLFLVIGLLVFKYFLVEKIELMLILLGFDGVLVVLYCIAMVIPIITMTVRRLHDINASGWFILLTFIPYIGSFTLLILNLIRGTQGENRYGEPSSF